MSKCYATFYHVAGVPVIHEDEKEGGEEKEEKEEKEESAE